jgi:hypothetical protein
LNMAVKWWMNEWPSDGLSLLVSHFGYNSHY